MRFALVIVPFSWLFLSNFLFALEITTNVWSITHRLGTHEVGMIFTSVDLDEPISRENFLRLIKTSNYIKWDYAHAYFSRSFKKSLLKHFQDESDFHSVALPFELVASSKFLAKSLLQREYRPGIVRTISGKNRLSSKNIKDLIPYFQENLHHMDSPSILTMLEAERHLELWELFHNLSDYVCKALKDQSVDMDLLLLHRFHTWLMRGNDREQLLLRISSIKSYLSKVIVQFFDENA